MKKLIGRRPAVAAIVLTPLALLILSIPFRWSATVMAGRSAQSFDSEEGDRKARQARLKTRLASARPGEFQSALASLASLDEPGALEVWKAALDNPDPELKKRAWAGYLSARPLLARREQVPQVARVAASADEISRAAASTGLEADIWSAGINESGNKESIVAAPFYLLEELRRAERHVSVLYQTIADWQSAAASNDALARSTTPRYLSDSSSQFQVRVVVIDMREREAPSTGYSDWLGDGENILARNSSFLAYLDVFPSDGSVASIDSHMQEQYRRRGYRVAAVYTLDQFAGEIGNFFPGESFDAGRRKPEQPGRANLALAEGRFHSYEETLAEFRALASANPTLAQVVELGQSHEGRLIFALKISKDVSVDDRSKPEVLVTGCHHGREWISVETPVHFANRLVKDYATDDKIRHLVDRLQVWIVPIVNPDGLTFSQNSPNDQMDAARLWRKNRRPISIANCGSSVGVDLNRNYDFEWRLPNDIPCATGDDLGASDDPENETFRGPRAESEPEVQVMTSLTNDPNRRFRVQLDYHNYSQLILYPWGYKSGNAPDSTVLADLARRMSQEIHSVRRTIYQPQQAVALYTTTGSSTDYAYGVNRVAAPFVIEMRPTCCNFNIRESDITAINEENWAGAQMMMSWAAGPPILESVKAFQAGPDGSFTKLVYSARWAESNNVRQLAVDTRFPGLEPGRIMLSLRFSKPMDERLLPVVSLGRGGNRDELRLVAVGGAAAWQKSIYTNDTWVGEAVIPQDSSNTEAWVVSVAASDAVPFSLDAAPETVAAYGVGADGWLNFEGDDGQGAVGGADRMHILSPTIRADFPNLFIASPAGGERVVGGNAYTVSWTIPKNAGFVP
ncbi:MAG TPA: M14 family metallopeptidase, partial [Blastocatellia bacterium]|nr:M14 family metallopeptidase [Blastocatellia bacterium]